MATAIRFCVGDSFYLSQNKVICHDCQLYKANFADALMSNTVDPATDHGSSMFQHQVLVYTSESYEHKPALNLDSTSGTSSVWHPRQQQSQLSDQSPLDKSSFAEPEQLCNSGSLTEPIEQVSDADNLDSDELEVPDDECIQTQVSSS